LQSLLPKPQNLIVHFFEAIKARCFLLRWFYPEYWWQYLLTWLTVDAAFIIGMAELRIPRLAFNWKARVVQILLLSLIDVVLFKPYEVLITLLLMTLF
jgi:nucleoporin POM152